MYRRAAYNRTAIREAIIVLPVGEEIEKFTPVQHPANDVNSDIITTHFDYHSIDGNLLKLDILGHDDPTMIRMLEDLTGNQCQGCPPGSEGCHVIVCKYKGFEN